MSNHDALKDIQIWKINNHYDIIQKYIYSDFGFSSIFSFRLNKIKMRNDIINP